jgi:uncharacterized protein GlcG (DUF336 family)
LALSRPCIVTLPRFEAILGQDANSIAMQEEIMRLGTVLLCAGSALAFTAVNAATTYDGNGQVPAQFVLTGKAADRLHDHNSINADTAEKLAKACEAIARKNNSQVVVVILDPQGLVVLNNRNVEDPFTNQNMAGYGLTTQEGGLPIIVNGQLIGAIGVGGIPPAERNATYGEEMCARDALVEVIGPQPPLLPDLAAQRRSQPAPAGGAGGRGRGAPNQ